MRKTNSTVEMLGGGAGSEAVLRRVHTMLEHIRGMPVREGNFIFHDTDTPGFYAMKLVGQACIVTRMRAPGQFTGYTVPNHDWLAIHIPLSWKGTYIFDGIEVRPGDAFVSGNPNGFTGRGQDRDSLTFGLYRPSLTAALRALSGKPEDEFSFSWLRFRPSSRLIKAALSQIGSVGDCSYAPTAVEQAHRFHGTPERDFVDLLAQEIFMCIDSASHVQTAPRRALDIVGEARELTVGAPGQPPSLSQLCCEIGVGQTRLFEAFQEIHGLSPHECLTGFRLSAAYERLSDFNDPPRSVKEIAFDAGFTKASYFARCFSERFGETPSAVLERKRKFG